MITLKQTLPLNGADRCDDDRRARVFVFWTIPLKTFFLTMSFTLFESILQIGWTAPYTFVSFPSFWFSVVHFVFSYLRKKYEILSKIELLCISLSFFLLSKQFERIERQRSSKDVSQENHYYLVRKNKLSFPVCIDYTFLYKPNWLQVFSL